MNKEDLIKFLDNAEYVKYDKNSFPYQGNFKNLSKQLNIPIYELKTIILSFGFTRFVVDDSNSMFLLIR